MAAPTAEELEVVKQFREKVKDLGLENATDLYMLRWLRARDFNISASEDMLRKHIQFRKEQNLDKILEWVPPESFNADASYKIIGNDDEGHPILIIPFGTWDIRKILNSGKPGMRDAWLRNVDQMFAKVFIKMEEMSLKYGREVTQCILIVDPTDFSMRQFTSFANINVILECARRYEANYPEILFAIYCINAFRVFQIFFGMLKPLLSPRTIGKVEIYTTQEKWLPVITSRLPKDQLPKELGGTQTRQQVSSGTELESANAEFDEADMTSIKISAGGICKLEFPVASANSILSWVFKPEAHDIGFSVYFGINELVELKRYEANGGLITGTVTCDTTGEYTLHFDNSYSRMRSKTVLYNIEVIEPQMSIELG